jgi:uncharacterized membrane protein YgcG
MAVAAPAAAALAAEHQQQQLQHPRLGSLQRISPPKTSSNESFMHQQVSSNWMLQQAATSSGVSGDAAAGAGLGLQVGTAYLGAAQQQQQQHALLQQSLWQTNAQQQQVPAGSQERGLPGVDAAAAAVAPLDGLTDDAAMLQELLDELCPSGQPAAATAAGDTTGQQLAAAVVPGGVAGPFGRSAHPSAAAAAAAAADSFVHQLAPQQQQQQQLRVIPQQQQQQVAAAGLDGMTWRQGSNSSSTSNVTNSSSASPPDKQATSAAAAAVCQAGVPTYSYAAYQAASQMQPGHQLLSLPVPDSLMQSIAADLGLPMQQCSSQKQQQQPQPQMPSLAHAASATQSMLLQQQVPVGQTKSWQGTVSTAAAAAGSAVPGLAGSSAAHCAAAPNASSSLLVAQQQYAYMAQQQQVSAPAGLQQGLLQLPQQLLQPAGMNLSRMPSLQAAAAVTAAPTSSGELAAAGGNPLARQLTGAQRAAAAAPATSAEAAAAAAGGNPLAGQLTGAQRAAAASHIRSMLMVAAAAGESSKAVLARVLQLMQQCGDWVPHTALLQLNSLSVKLMGAQPCDLPEDVREQLIAAVVGATMPEAFLRPGCSLITLDYASFCSSSGSSSSGSSSSGSSSSGSSSSGSSGVRGEVDKPQHAAAVLQRLCRHSSSWFAQQDLRVQLAATFAEWLPTQQQQQQQGEVEGSSSSSCAAAAAAAPLVVLACRPALYQQHWQGAWLAVSCHGLAEGEQLQLTARGAGQYYEIDEESIAVERCAALPPSNARSGSSSSTWGSWLGSRLSRHAGFRPTEAAAAAGGQGCGQSVLVWFKLAAKPHQGPLRIEVTCSSSSGASGFVVSAAAVQQAALALLHSCCA